ncbi:ATP-binding protein [Sporanaerobium hydrogeniformans]|uniref:ATP-binding protein n=1 Tax=Sporanaerobium hydrogeniformans TaxID=3072179 RepID=A0AC61DEX8_9FIRM|nr:ATP-binding protein [Sporanaerobium hydrogeniformans]PHV71472.1 ATP-binding protein [Sporanaerobium hydrogeniformans]
MRELALHLLDIMQNSIKAGATHIHLEVSEQVLQNKLILKVEDNGKGMSKEMCNQVIHPYVTTRTLRKVGLGIPLLYQLCKECEGELKIESELGRGTKLEATLVYNHIDRLPLGNIASTLGTVIMAKPEITYTYRHFYNEKCFELSTEQIKEVLEGVPIENLEIIAWLENYIEINITALYQMEASK